MIMNHFPTCISLTNMEEVIYYITQPIPYQTFCNRVQEFIQDECHGIVLYNDDKEEIIVNEYNNGRTFGQRMHEKTVKQMCSQDIGSALFNEVDEVRQDICIDFYKYREQSQRLHVRYDAEQRSFIVNMYE